MAEEPGWHPLIPNERKPVEETERISGYESGNAEGEINGEEEEELPPRALAKISGSVELADRSNLMNAWGHEKRAEIIEVEKRERERIGEQLLQSLLEDDEETALDLIWQPLVNINHASATGVTPLMLACFKGFDTVVTALIKKGADVNRVDKDGTTALIYACRASEAKIAMALLDVEGIDVNARSTVFGTALENCDQPAKSWNIRLVASGITMEKVKVRLRELGGVGGSTGGSTAGYRRKRSTRHKQKKRRSTHKRRSRR